MVCLRAMVCIPCRATSSLKAEMVPASSTLSMPSASLWKTFAVANRRRKALGGSCSSFCSHAHDSAVLRALS
jgi:hypothetical protein